MISTASAEPVDAANDAVAHGADAAPAPRPRRRGLRRALLWGLLTALLAVAQTLLVLLALNYEATRAQDRSEAVAAAAAALTRQRLARGLQSLQALLWNEPTPAQWRNEATELLRAHRELLHIERRNAAFALEETLTSPYLASLFEAIPRAAMSIEAEFACNEARRGGAPAFSRSYFIPQPGGLGVESIDLCLPIASRPPL